MFSAIIVLRSQRDLAASAKEPYALSNVLMYNQFTWTTAYFVGLQFTHFDRGPMTGFSLTPDKIKQWPKLLWLLLMVILTIIMGFFVYLIIVYVHAGVIWWYLGFFLIIILGFASITAIFRRTHHIHVHHYTCGMVLIVLCGYQSIPASLFHGFCNGMMIEGGARWGYDPIWVRKQKVFNINSHSMPIEETYENSD